MKRSLQKNTPEGVAKESHPKLTVRVFFLTVATFFMSSLMTNLGSLVDAFVVGQTMETTDVGALSLTSPMWLVTGIIYGVLSMGCQPFIARELGRGDKEKAKEYFSMVLMTGLAVSVLLTILILTFSGFTVRLLGASPGRQEYEACRKYLLGAAIGLPGLTMMSLLSVGINIEGARRWSLYSALVTTVSNVLLDLLVMRLHGSIFMMGLTTSFSYILGAFVLALYYLTQKEAFLRPKLTKICFRDLGRMIWRGMPLGVSRMTATFRSFYLNHLLAASSTADGLAAYQVQVQLNYLTNALFMSVAQAMSLLLCLYYAEEDKKGLRNTVVLAVCFETVFGVILTILLQNREVISVISRAFLGENSLEAQMVAGAAVFYFAVGLLGQALSVLFANYLQAVGRTMMSKVVYVICDMVLLVLFVSVFTGRLAADTGDAVRAGAIFRGASYAQLSMLLLIPILIIVENLRMNKKLNFRPDTLMMLPKEYGISPENELTGCPKDVREVTEFSEKAHAFCLDRGIPKREAYYIALAAEEMASNVIKYGFRRDRGKKALELRVIRMDDNVILRLRDNSHLFDPVKKMALVADNPDPAAYVGIRMVRKLASDIAYTSTLKLNNLMIRIDLPKEGQAV